MSLLQNFSVEITGRDIQGLAGAQALLPPETRVNVTYLGTEDREVRVSACRAARALGFVPVPHLAARRFESEAVLRDYLRELSEARCMDEVFVVGGDPTTPFGPFHAAIDILKTGLLSTFGGQRVSIAGYPEGHPDIETPVLDAALEAKVQELTAAGLAGSIITQFTFDVNPLLNWIEALRGRGIDLQVRVGVAGPAGVRRLLSFAKRFGVSSSAGIVKKYGFSLTNLLGTAGPDSFVTQLAERYDPGKHGEVALHFYTFGGLEATAKWIDQFAARSAETR
jgi:methylenetetrahydrofolate reductase (NADPH)